MNILRRIVVILAVIILIVALQSCAVSAEGQSFQPYAEATVSPDGEDSENLQEQEKTNSEEAYNEVFDIMASDELELSQPYPMRKLDEKVENGSDNLSSNSSPTKTVLKLKRGANENLSDLVQHQRHSFLGSSSYWSCQNSKTRQGELVIGFAELLEITSPNHPDPYPNNARCVYRFEIPSDRRANLTCPVYDIGPGDKLTINGLEMPINLNTGKVYSMKIRRDFELVFTSDAEGSSSGFNCSMSAFPPGFPLEELDDIFPPWGRGVVGTSPQ